MKKNTARTRKRRNLNWFALPTSLLALAPFILGTQTLLAGSAKWNLNPSSSDWNTTANWTPATVPMNAGDIATFGISNTVSLSTSAYTLLGSIVFEAGASPYTITASPQHSIEISGGIMNGSGVAQNFRATVDDEGHSGAIIFASFFPGNATAGTNTIFTASARKGNSGDTGDVEFVYFASAEEGVFFNEGGEVDGSIGGHTRFFGHSNGGNAEITSKGGLVSGAGGGTTYFFNLSDARNATLIANGGVNGGEGGQIIFSNSAKGANARIKVFGNGQLGLSFRNAGLTIGSLEGDGRVDLGGFSLAAGSKNLTTTFSGTIVDGIYGPGSFTKVGTGTFTLSGANTYTRGTTVSAGTLKVANNSGSATGSATVKIDAGTLGGPGHIAGAVRVGTGSGPGAFLNPGVGGNEPTRLTIRRRIAFEADGVYTCKLNTKRAQADQIVAKGVTIEGGAQFDLVVVANAKLSPGTAFTVIDNMAATPIDGAFVNLPDDSILTVGRNSYQVSYSGGDGNDLTLMVVP